MSWNREPATGPTSQKVLGSLRISTWSRCSWPSSPCFLRSAAWTCRNFKPFVSSLQGSLGVLDSGRARACQTSAPKLRAVLLDEDARAVPWKPQRLQNMYDTLLRFIEAGRPGTYGQRDNAGAGDPSSVFSDQVVFDLGGGRSETRVPSHVGAIRRGPLGVGRRNSRGRA